MTHTELKQIINEVLIENGEITLANINKLIDKPTTVEDFMKSLVGKKLKNLLDASSFLNLYVMNKYGVGSNYDESDIQVLTNNLIIAAIGFINNRVLEPIIKQRDVWEKEKYSTPEYKEWNKQRSAAFKTLLNARKSGDEVEIDKAKKHYDNVMSSDPTFGDYKQMMDDQQQLIKQFHNIPLTIMDVLPGPNDTEQDKKNWQIISKAFDKLKKLYMNESKLRPLIKSIIKEILIENEGDYPTSTVQISTLNGTTVLLYSGDVSDKDDITNDVYFKTPTKFSNILNVVRGLKSKESSGEKTTLHKFMLSDRDVISVLLNLTDDELNQLETNKIVVTNNIPNEIFDLTGKHISVQDQLTRQFKKESGDPFRDIVKKNAELYRDTELARGDKEKYNTWLKIKSQKPNDKNKKRIG